MVLLPAVVAMAVDSCKKLPWEVLVTDITLNTTSIRLEEGETFQLSATVSPDDATNKKVNWQTGNSAIAKVDETGLVSAVGVGKTTVKAKSDDGSITETCDVEVVRKVVSVEKVNLDRDVVDLKIGESVTLVATVSPANADNKAVVWNSSDTKVATVTAGKITGLAVGKTTVTVTTEDGGKTASCEVTVLTDVIAVTGVSLDKTVAEMEVGDELTLTATVTPDDATNKNVIWSSSNTAVATVTDGKVTAVKAGTVIINVATEDGGKTAGCEITVKDKIIPVTSVSLDKTSLEMVEGGELTLVATVNPDNATDKSVSWTSSDASVASVVNGKVTALKAGTATITVTTTDGGKTASCEVTVKAKLVGVTSVSLDKTTAELTEGDELTLTATVNPDNATDKSVTWSSSDSSVASVANGKVTALKAGTATITVTTTDGGKTAKCDVTVKAKIIPVTSVSLDKTSLEMVEGGELTLVATVNPDNATDKSVSWTSSDASVASVVNGKVTALNAGTATITVTTTDGGKTASCEVTVKTKLVGVTSVSLDKTTAELTEGDELTLTATVNPDNATDKSVTWSSSDASVASVVNGKVTALKAGTATITVTTTDGGKTAKCEVTVKAKLVGVSSVSLDKTTAELTEGDELTLTATVNPDNATDKSVSWTSSDASVASVVNGKVTALKAGTATITVTTTDGGKTAKCEVTVKAKLVGVSSVSLDKTTAELTEGDELTLTATVNPDNATDKSVTWSSSDASVASVVNGKVTALKAGTATITVTTTDGGKTASCEVTVNTKLVGVTSVSLDKTTAELTEGDELTLTATVNPDNATDKSVSWSSSDSSVASVVNGKVTALKAGTATITVTTTDGGKTASCAVTVKAKYVAVSSVSLDKTSAELIEGHELTLTATVNPDNATDKSVTWTSSDASVASVVNGKVTAHTPGTATITVTTTDGNMTADCVVTVKEQPIVTLNQSVAEMIVGDEMILGATVSVAGTELIWTSSDATVATVTDGKVKAIKAGVVTITVTTADGGSSASCEITVTEATGNVTGVMIDKSSAILKIGDSITLKAVITPTNADNRNVTWSSTDNSVASVDAGVVTALKVGTATIVVTTEDGNKTAYCKVKVIADEGNEGVGENEGNWE